MAPQANFWRVVRVSFAKDCQALLPDSRPVRAPLVAHVFGVLHFFMH